MKVRCGACRAEFEVSGPGRYPCPQCRAVNQVGAGAAGSEPAPPGAPTAPSTASAGRPAPTPVTHLSCPDCGFAFVVGDVTTAPCPMCGVTVEVGEG